MVVEFLDQYNNIMGDVDASRITSISAHENGLMIIGMGIGPIYCDKVIFRNEGKKTW